MDGKRVLWVNAGFASEAGRLSGAWRTACLQPTEALNELKNKEFHAVVLEFPMPDWTPEELLLEVQRLAPETPILLRDPEAKVSDAVRLARLGAYQMLDCDQDPTALIRQAIEERSPCSLMRLVSPAGLEEWESLLVGSSHEMRRVSHIIRMVGRRRSTVLILGETGTGKELAARALHRLEGIPWWRVARSDGTLAPLVAFEQAQLLRAEGWRGPASSHRKPYRKIQRRRGRGARTSE